MGWISENKRRLEDRIPFNKPYMAGKELYYIAEAVAFGNVSGDGVFTIKCSELLEERFGIESVLLTPSCTAALEMASILCAFEPGDEVIMPSYTFVSTASAFVRCGAKPVFVDIRQDTLNLDEEQIEGTITDRTKAIVPVHYAGVGCEMDRIMEIAAKYELRVVEDAAQGVNATYRGQALGGIGHLGAYSFHETKNYICGEGGALCVNDPALLDRAEIIRDKGTNRKNFTRGKVDKYTWVDVGSSYVSSEILSAFLYAQLELLDAISERRKHLFELYYDSLKPLADAGLLSLPVIPSHCETNYHMFFVLVRDQARRDGLIEYLKQRNIYAVFHYVPLHSSPMGRRIVGDHVSLPVTDDASSRLVRLPLYYELEETELLAVAAHVADYVRGEKLSRYG